MCDSPDVLLMEGDARGVRVGMTKGRGRGLFATRALAAGDTALVERCARRRLQPMPAFIFAQGSSLMVRVYCL